jgi:hypothetical protein
VSGFVKPGTLLSLMGASGAGKVIKEKERDREEKGGGRRREERGGRRKEERGEGRRGDG